MKEKSTSDISICIATFLRPQGLSRLLRSLQNLNVTPKIKVEVIIVDNDHKRTAWPIVKSFQGKLDSLKYFVEPQQNIALARNRAIDEAQGDWIAFIDDDEEADKNWLATYWQVEMNSKVDGFFGPVISVFEQDVPAWMDKERFFSRHRFKTGQKLDFSDTRSGNALVRRDLFKEYRFNPSFGLTGGEDTDVFSRMIEGGAVFCWCDEAIVYEFVMPGRLSLNWLLRRNFRGGITYTLVKKSQQRRSMRIWMELPKAIIGIFIFTLSIPFEMFRGRSFALSRLLRVALQVGHICGFFNMKYHEYKRHNG